jgi:SHS2 domain-containing protein
LKNYELIEHTADVGIRVKGADLSELFKNAALAMFDIMAERVGSGPSRQAIIIQEAYNVEELFINWLNELLSLSSAKEILFSDFQIDSIDNQNLKIIALGSDSSNYKFNTEIKAATYQELKVEKTSSGWQAQVIFDV